MSFYRPTEAQSATPGKKQKSGSQQSKKKLINL